MFNLSYSVNNTFPAFNLSYDSTGAEIIVLSNITDKENKYVCTVAGVEVLMDKFYIFRRSGFLTTIVVQLAEDVWDFVKTQTGAELIISWQSENFNGIMANSLIQNVSYRNYANRDNGNRRVIKLHAFRAIREVAQSKFILNDIVERRIENNVLKSIACNPQPTISPEDTVEIEGVDYIVNSVKIVADTFRTNMVITF